MAAESKLEAKLREYAEEQGCLFLKTVAVGERGFPDRTLIGLGGMVAFMELKTPQGRLSPHQLRMHDNLRKRGCKVYIVRTFETGKKIIDEINPG